MPILSQTFPPAPGGMNVALAAQEIDDTEARYLQDILLDSPGLARVRGPVTATASVSGALPRRASGLVTTVNPAGSNRFAALTGTAANGYLTVWNASLSAVTDLTWPYALPADPVSSASTAYRAVAANPALGGGTWIGTASNYTSGSNQALGLWRGGSSPDYTTGTVTFTRGSTGVTGAGTSWVANVTPGMFLFANTNDAGAGTFTSTLIGVVLSVTNNTTLTLTQAAPYSGTAVSYTLTSLRGFIPKVAKGRITTDTASTTVSGGSTKFNAQGLGTGTWNLYRSRDLTWIGKVASVQSDISLTLAANAAIALADESYVAIRGDWSVAEKSVDIGGATNKVGWISAIYAERQWYANNSIDFTKTYRLHFSSTGDLEAVDMTDDGDWIPISSTTDAPEPIRALAPTYNALVVLKDTETFAVYGTTPSSFSSKKLADDGVLSTMGVQSYGGGCIWPGRNGLYYYDGVSVTDLAGPKFGNVWKNTVRTFDPLRYRVWSMIVRNHYFLFFESLVPTIQVVKGTTAVTPTHWTVVVNMDTQAFTLHKNLGIRGAVQLPAELGRGVWYLVNSGDNSVANSSFETDASSWAVFGGGTAIARITTDSYYGSACGQATFVSDGSGNQGIYHTDDMPVDPGQTVTGSFWVKGTAGQVVGSYLHNTSWGELVGFTSTTLTGAWQQVVMTGSFTAATAGCGIVIDSRTNGATSFKVDGVQLVKGGSQPFVDTPRGVVCDATDLFDSEALDTIVSTPSGAVGPDWYVETKKYNAGEDVRLKRFKLFAAHYMSQGGGIKLDAVLGLNNVGTTLSTIFPASVLTWDSLRVLIPTWSGVPGAYGNWNALIQGVFQPKRARFLKKAHHISFRMYQENSTQLRTKVGPWKVGFKLMRDGRV